MIDLDDIGLPVHACSLHLTHNYHRDMYQTVREWDADNQFYDWISDEERERSLDGDELWTIQWYPHTPIGFHSLCASDLNRLLEAAREVK